MRIKRTRFAEDKKELNALIDERVDPIDEFTTRIIYCVVEAPKATVDLEKEKSFFANLKTEINVKKFHFTDVNDATMRQKIVQHIAFMSIRVKTYVYYSLSGTEDTMKKKCIKNVVKNTQKSLEKSSRLVFYIERATQYSEIIKNKCLINEDTLTIIPDVFCYVSAMRLDYAKISSIKQTLARLNDHPKAIDEAFNMEWYDILSEKIRLWSYFTEQTAIRASGDRRPSAIKR